MVVTGYSAMVVDRGFVCCIAKLLEAVSRKFGHRILYFGPKTGTSAELCIVKFLSVRPFVGI